MGNQVGVGQRGQLDQPDAVRKILDEILRDLQRQPRFTGATCAGQCDQPFHRDERLHLRDLVLTSDEPGEL